MTSPLLSVIVPVFDEQNTIDTILFRVLAAAPTAKEVLIVDDGSTDGTRCRLARWRDHERVRLFFHEANRGKGAAIRTALPQARGIYAVVQDADLEYDPNDYAALLKPLLDGEADVVYGSRPLGRSLGNRDRSFLNPFRLGVAALNHAVRLLYGVTLTDEATCYKVFPTATLRAMDLACERFEFCPEVTAKAARMNLRIAEVPIHYLPRSVAEGKKIGLRDAMHAFVTLWKWRRWRPPPSVANLIPKPHFRSAMRNNEIDVGPL